MKYWSFELENEVFAEDEEKYVGTQWMNEILVVL
jgi:hypothetical protein